MIKPRLLPALLEQPEGEMSQKEKNLMRRLLDKPPPFTTAESWVVIEQNNSKLLFGRFEKERKEIASLTKVMTAYTVLNLVEKLGININTELVTITEEATHVIGTSAELVAGDMLTIKQLMYGMMLPSGNDAAFALA